MLCIYVYVYTDKWVEVVPTWASFDAVPLIKVVYFTVGTGGRSKFWERFEFVAKSFGTDLKHRTD